MCKDFNFNRFISVVNSLYASVYICFAQVAGTKGTNISDACIESQQFICPMCEVQI